MRTYNIYQCPLCKKYEWCKRNNKDMCLMGEDEVLEHSNDDLRASPPDCPDFSSKKEKKKPGGRRPVW